jgi:hypothetical protein
VSYLTLLVYEALNGSRRGGPSSTHPLGVISRQYFVDNAVKMKSQRKKNKH